MRRLAAVVVLLGALATGLLADEARAVVAVPAASGYGELVADGLFTTAGTPALYATYTSGKTLGGWTVTSGSVDHIGGYWVAPSIGGNSIDLDGDVPGAIAQTVTTVSGATYRLGYFLAANPGNGGTASVRVTTGATTTTDSATGAGASTAAMGWRYREVGFTASATSTTIGFTSLDASGASGPAVAGIRLVRTGNGLATTPTVTAPAATSTTPVISWPAVSGASRYVVYRAGTLVSEGPALSYTDTPRPADGTYAYAVATIDASGNEGTSVSASVTVDTVAPAAPAAPTGTTPTNAKPVLGWTAVSGASTYRVVRAGTTLATVATTTYTDAALGADGSYDYTLYAIDAAGNVSTASPALTVVYDTTAPAAPAAPTATSPTRTAPVLSWTAVTGASTYNVYRGGVLAGSPTTTTFTDSAATANTTATYTVRALDAAGNASAQGAGTSVVYDTAHGVTLDTYTQTIAYNASSTSTLPTATTTAWTLAEPWTVATMQNARLRALLTPTTTGDYTFWLAADDDAYLQVSTDATAANLGIKAFIPNGTSTTDNQWALRTSQRSVPIHLVAGAPYLIQIWQRDIGGSNGAHVQWSAAGLAQQDIPYGLLTPTATGCVGWCPPNSSTLPTSPSFTGLPLVGSTLTLQPSSFPSAAAASVTWQRCTTATTSTCAAIAGATGLTYVLQAADAGKYVAPFGAGSSGYPWDWTTTPALVAAAGSTGAAVDYFDGIGVGATLATGTTGANPASTIINATFQSPNWTRTTSNGTRIRALLTPTVSGVYTFYLAGDDETVLRLSPSTDPADARAIAYIAAWTSDNQWTKYTTQTSSPVTLVAGQQYFLEGWSANGTGPGGLHVQWSRTGVAQADIPSAQLSPVVTGCTGWCRILNTAPTITGTATSGSLLAAATAGDWAGTTGTGYQWQRCLAGVCTDVAGAADATYALSAVDVGATLRVRAMGGGAIPGQWGAYSAQTAAVTTGLTGYQLDAWSPVAGLGLEEVQTGSKPGASTALVAGPLDAARPAVSGGERLRAFVVPPATGTFTFRLAADGQAVLRLSGDATAANLAAIASVRSTVPVSAYTTYASQTSAPVALVAGRRYLIEALAQLGSSTRHLQVAWSSAALAQQVVAQGQLVATATGTGTWDGPAIAVGTGATADTWWSTNGSRLTDIDQATGSATTTTVASLHSPNALVGRGAANGTRVRAVLTPKATDTYAFTLTGADEAVLTIADPATPLVRRPIAYLGPNSADTVTGPATALAAGSSYLLELWQKSGSGAGVNVQWQSPSIGGPQDVPSGQVGPTSLGCPGWCPPTAPVVAGPSRPAVTNDLKVDPGSWLGAATAEYRWQRCDTTGATCTDIPGATAQGYTVSDADSGSTLRVRVRSANGAWGSSGVTTTIAYRAATAPVLSAASQTAGPLTLSWTVPTGGGAAREYLLYRDGVQVGGTSATSLVDPTGPAVDGASDYSVAAVGPGGTGPRSASVAVVWDRIPPAAPDVTAPSPTNAAPALTLGASADRRVVVIFRNGTEYGKTDTTTWVDPAPLPDGTVEYTAYAIDDVGNRSAGTVTRVVVDTSPPDTTITEAPSSPFRGSTAIGFASSEPGSTFACSIDGAEPTRCTSPLTLRGLANGEHKVVVTATDAVGNPDPSPAAVGVVRDAAPPAAPDLTALSPTNAHPVLTWSPVDDAVVYVIARNGSEFEKTTATTFEDPEALADDGYEYDVTAYDSAGNRGLTAAVKVVIDTVAPDPVKGLDAPSPTAAAPALRWEPVADADHYVVLRDDVPVGRTDGPELVDDPVPADGTYVYSVVAVDAAGNEAKPSDPIKVEVDTVLPDGPGELAAASPTRSAPALTWSAPPQGARLYRVYRDGARIGETTDTTFTDTGPADGSYTYTVTAWRPAGESAASDPVVVVLDSTPPEPPTLDPVATPTRNAPVLTWPAAGDAATYTVVRDGVRIGVVTGTTFIDVGLFDGTYTYTVEAADALGNTSDPGAPRAVVYDTTAPAVPGPPVAAASPTRQGPRLDWTPIVDAVAYVAYRDGVPVGESSMPAFVDGPPPADGPHRYAVAAIDAAGNRSEPGAETVVVVDTVAPTVPGVPTAASPTRRAPSLAWSAVEPGATYELLRDGDVVTTTTSLAADDPTVPAEGPHAYALRATDAAGNATTIGPSVTVVVDLTAPAPPVVAVTTPTRTAPVLTWPAVADASALTVRRDGEVVSALAGGATTFTDAPVPPDGAHVYSVTASDPAGNAATSDPAPVVVDTVAPVPPAAPAADLNPTSGRPSLSWPAVSDARRYRIARDGTVIATITTTSFEDAAVATDGTYAYTLAAIDEAGNVSAPGPETAVVRDAAVPADPPAPQGASPTRVAPQLSWVAVPRAARYRVLRDGVVAGTVATTSFTDTALTAEGDHVYALVALSATSVPSAAGAPVPVTYDATPPAPPGAPTAASPTPLPSLSWQPVATATAYRLLRDGTVVATVTGTNADDAAAGTDGSYGYTVVALDAAGNASDPSPETTVVRDATPPARSAAPTAASPTRNALRLAWDAVPGASRYRVLRDGVLLDTVSATTYRDGDALADGHYGYSLVALDDAGNAAAASPPTTVVLDTLAPAAPVVTASSPTAHAPDLTWTADPTAAGYRVTRDDTPVATPASASFRDDASLADGSYAYAVVAFDAAGNVSDPGTATVVLDQRPPDAPTGLAAASPTATSPHLAWEPGAGVDHYDVRRNGVEAGSAREAVFTEVPVPADGSYAYTVIAVDGAGNESPPSAAVHVLVTTTLPDGPTGLAAVSPTNRSPRLTWTAPVQGVDGYGIYRDGVRVGTATATAFADPLPDDGDHAYAVTAFDVAGESAASGLVVVTVDTVGPAAPDRLVAATPTRQRPALRWDPVADAVRYRVTLDGVEVGTTVDPDWTSPAVPADGDGTYAVTAIDAAGNEGTAATIVVTVDTGAPGAPTGLAAVWTPTAAAPSLRWDPSADAASFEVLRDGRPVGTSPSTTFVEDAIPADGTYRYTVRAVDAAGNVSGVSTPVDVVVDTVAPLRPGGLAAATPTATAPALHWLPVAGATGYRVRRDDDVVATTDAATLTDTAVPGDGTYRYTVTALDEAGNESRRSDIAEVVYDATPPPAPAAPTVAARTNVAPHLHWPAAGDAVRYRIVRDGLAIAETAALEYVDRLLADEGPHGYALVAVDAAGNESDLGGVATVTLDTVPPAVPAPTAPSPTRAAPVLAWAEVAGAVAYRVRRGGVLVRSVDAGPFTDTGATGDGAYEYTVEALDAAGNVSDPGGPVTVVVDTTAPATPVVRADRATRTVPALRWDDVPGATRYAITVADGRTATTVAPRFDDIDATTDGDVTYRVTALDAAGNESAPSEPVTVTVDHAAPTAPTGLVADPPATETSPALRWDAVVAAARYAVLRDGVAVGATADTAYVDTDVARPGRFHYTVRALDEAGNASPDSNVAVVLFHPGAPAVPGVPTGDSPVNHPPVIAWEAVPNVASYIVERDGVVVGRSTDNRFTDPGPATEGVAVYRVASVAASGAESDPGPSLAVTVDLTAPATTITEAPAGPVRDRATFTLAADDPAATFRCSLDGVEPVPCASPLTLHDLTTGTHTLLVAAVDEAGNVDTEPAVATIVADVTPPAPPVLAAVADTDVPLNSRAGAVLTHAQAAGDAVRIVLSRDGTDIADGGVDLGHRDGDLRDGTRYTYRAVAYDAVGNASAAAVVTVTTPDRTPPRTPDSLTGTGYPLVVGWNPDPATTFTLRRADAVVARLTDTSFADEDAVDGAAPPAPTDLAVTARTATSVTVSWATTVDRGTPYSYALAGADAEGNQGETSAPATLEAVSGTTRYRVTVDGAPAGETDSTSIELHGVDVATPHAIALVAIDGAGNVSDASAPLGVGAGAVPARPAGLVAAATPTRAVPSLTWSPVDGAVSYVVRRDGVDVGETTDPAFADEGLAVDGTYTYAVVARNDLQILSAASDPVTVVVDRAAPDTTITAAPTGVARSEVTIEFAADETAATFTCGVDDVAPAPCTSPWTLHDLAAGRHAIAITSADAAGNVDATPATVELVVDHTAPAEPVLTAAADTSLPLGSSLARVAVHAEPGVGGTRVVVVREAVAVIDGAAADVVDDVEDGVDVTYTAVSYDRAGNASRPTAVTVSTPDRTPPDAPALTPLDGYPQQVRIEGVGGGALELQRDGVAVAGATDGTFDDVGARDTAAPDAPGGVHLSRVAVDGFDIAWTASADAATAVAYRARVTDAAGNAGPWSAAATGLVRSGVTAYAVLVDGVQVQTTTEPAAHVAGIRPDNSTHTLRVTAVDAAGNGSAPSAPLTLLVGDRTGTDPPAVTAVATPTAARPGDPIAFDATADPAGSAATAWAWTFDDGTTADTAAVSHAFASPGRHVGTAVGSAADGSSQTVRVAVLVDDTAPRIAAIRVLGGVLTVDASDLESGLADVGVTVDGRTTRLRADVHQAVRIAGGRHRIVVRATDLAGNAAVAVRTLRTATGPPHLRVRGPVFATGRTAPVSIRLDPGASSLRSLRLDGTVVTLRGGAVSVRTGRRHVVVGTAIDGSASRVVFAVERLTLLHLIHDPALDGARGDQLWFDGREQTGARLAFLRAVEERLVLLGLYGRSDDTRFTGTLHRVVQAYQVAHRCSAPGRPDWGTIGPCTTRALDRAAAGARRIWRDPAP